METTESKNRFISSSEVKEKGRGAYYKILEDARKGNMVCIRRGVYATMEQLADTMIDLDVVVPDGILCLFSEWNIHPSIELHFLTESILELGVEEKVVSGYKIKVYNVERSVCDAIKYRNKIGIDVCSEVVNNYLSLPNRNLTLLMDYANKLRVTRTLEKYLEIKL